MSTPAPVPYYRPYRQRSVIGPLVLITVGLVALLSNMGVIDKHSLGWWFARYWPLVLIFWGVVRLAEFYWARQQQRPTPRMGGGAVVFLVFFTIFGMAATSASGWNWNGIRTDLDIDDSDIDLGFLGTRYDLTNTFSQPLTEGTDLRVLCNTGDVKITASEDNQAHVILHKTLRSDSKESADKIDASTTPKFIQQGSVWVLDLSTGDYQHGRFNLDLQIPRRLALSVSSHKGDITIAQREAKIEITTDHGDIDLEDVKGDASLRLRHGSLTAKKINGNLELDGRISDANISDVTGTLTLTGTYWGETQLARIGKPVRFTTSRTELQFAKLDGELTIRPGDLRANSLIGPLRLETTSKSLHLEDVSGNVHITDRNGEVRVVPKAPLGDIDINNVHGQISLELPAAAAFNLEAESRGGNIDSDFNVNVDNSGRDATAKGTVGKGGPNVRLQADHGTIQIKKQ